jgi:hypothetical protein
MSVKSLLFELESAINSAEWLRIIKSVWAFSQEAFARG